MENALGPRVRVSGETGGAGLGLAIVARIMAAHGGRLETVPARCELAMVFPEPGQGTVPG